MTFLCNGLNLAYCHIIDGRELPGLNANPPARLLEGKGFLGNQAHERDGALYYWLQRKGHISDIFFEELSHRILHYEDAPDYHFPIGYDGENTYLCFSPTAPEDMEQAAGQFVEKAKKALRGVKRHSGPSTLFKYFYQAGIETCSAELMYGPLEVILAALRGAGIAYGRETFGAHLAVQWGTTPHDTKERYRRYRLALFVSYLQGVSHINTEEGLYRMEELFAVLDRFSGACLCHGEVEREFVRFVRSHTRRGKMVRGAALLHGTYDGWACFCRRELWAQEGAQWKFDTPEKSWDLIRVFYPDSVLDAIYRHPCENAPQGYYTRTPYGSVDILPVEAPEAVMQTYGAMAFLGWNTADAGQIERLTAYVQNGGTLLMGWPHLFADKKREDAISGTPHVLEAEKLTGVRFCGFGKRQAGQPTKARIELLADTQILEIGEETDETGLVTRHKLGKGTVYLVNAREYPGDEAVSAVYERLLEQLARKELKKQQEKGILTGNDTVEYTAYDRGDGTRVIYAVNIDWYSENKEEAEAVLKVGELSWQVKIKRDRIHIFTVCAGAAAETSDICAEVLEMKDTAEGLRIRAQGKKGDSVTVYTRDGVLRHSIDGDGVAEVTVGK